MHCCCRENTQAIKHKEGQLQCNFTSTKNQPYVRNAHPCSLIWEQHKTWRKYSTRQPDAKPWHWESSYNWRLDSSPRNWLEQFRLQHKYFSFFFSFIFLFFRNWGLHWGIGLKLNNSNYNIMEKNTKLDSSPRNQREQLQLQHHGTKTTIWKWTLDRRTGLNSKLQQCATTASYNKKKKRKEKTIYSRYAINSPAVPT